MTASPPRRPACSTPKAIPLRYELRVTAIGTAIVALVAHRLPQRVSLGALFVAAAVTLLLLGLVRDLIRLRLAKRTEPASETVTCLCVESIIGITAIVAGLALAFAWESMAVPMGRGSWSLVFLGVALFSSATREVVFDWRAMTFRLQPNHSAAVVWRRGR